VPAAVRYKNWKMYCQLSQPGATGGLMPVVAMHWTLVDNIKRDPFEQATGLTPKTANGIGEALARAFDGLRTTGTCFRSAALAQVARVAEGIPADAGAGKLQSQRGRGAG
jgi:hypothetical protein